MGAGHFPDALKEPLEFVGTQVTRRALSERRNIVTEVVGHERKPHEELLDHLKTLGYQLVANQLQCDVDEAMRRNENRGDNISSYYAEPIHRKWIIDACVELAQVRDRLES